MEERTRVAVGMRVSEQFLAKHGLEYCYMQLRPVVVRNEMRQIVRHLPYKDGEDYVVMITGGLGFSNILDELR